MRLDALQGIDVKDSKFNIVSPGADQDIYFPRWVARGQRQDWVNARSHVNARASSSSAFDC
jgi:Sucrose synthase